MRRLSLLALGMLAVPLVTGLLGVAQRYLGAAVGEGVICDLRTALFAHLHRMSLRFFTNTKTGELISRLNNDVIGAQRAVSGTIVDLFTNIITLISALAIMLRLEWRLTLLAIMVLPLFLIPARAVGQAAARRGARADDAQRRDERHDGRDPQRQRRAAGQAVRPRGERGGALPRPGAAGALGRRAAGVHDALVLPDGEPDQRGRHGGGVLGRRSAGAARAAASRSARSLRSPLTWACSTARCRR